MKLHSHPSRHWIGTLPLFVAALLWFSPVIHGQSPAPAGALVPVRLTFGMSITSFADVNRNDAEAALKTFTDTVARKRGFTVAFKARIFDDPVVYQQALRDHQMLAAMIDGWDYLGAVPGSGMQISFVKERGGEIGEQYLLLTRRSSGLNTLADLRGKDVTLLESSNAKLGRRWLDYLILTNGLGDPAAFFGKRESFSKPSPVTLPVFFGKRPACVITRAAFDVMSQLNPQLGRELQPIARSPLLVESFLCTAESGWETDEFRAAFFRGVQEMGEEPAGQQILNLFRADRFVPFQPEHLKTLVQLRTDYERIRQKGQP